MKKAVLTGIRALKIQDVPPPVMTKPTDVLLRMNVVGLCGSDVHYYSTGRIGEQVVEYPYAVGHEASATVEATGDDVDTVKPGDRVAIEPGVPCHNCDQCRIGRHHTCRNLNYLACPGQIEGCLAEKIVMPAECCYPVGDSMSDENAALSEPLSIGVYAVQESLPMPGKKVGVLGVGPIGLSVMLAARAAGADSMYATDLLNYRCAAAEQHGGARWAGNPEEEDIVAAIREREPGLLDVVFECCGKQEAIDQAIDLLKPGGKLMIVGIPRGDRLSYQAHTARRKEICIQNVRRQNHCVRKTLDMIAQGETDPSFMATHRYGLDEVKAAFDLMENYEDNVIKAMVYLRGEHG